MPNRPIECLTFDLNIIVENIVEIPIAIEALRREYIKDINVNSKDAEYLSGFKEVFKHWATSHIDTEKYDFENKDEYLKFNNKLDEEINRVIDTYKSFMDRDR